MKNALERKQQSSSNAGRRVRMSRESRKQQLLETALTLFIERGYQGTSIEELARAAGVTRPVIYTHFGSKDGIYLACLRRARARLDRMLTGEASHTLDPRERLERGIAGYFAFVEQDREAWHLLFGGGSAVAGPAAEEVTRLRFSTVARITALLGGLFPRMSSERLQAYAHLLSGAGEQLAKWWFENPHLERQQLIDHFVTLAWGGLEGLQKEAIGDATMRPD